MATYYTKSCPYCGYKYMINSPVKHQYGSPIRTCQNCGNVYNDRDFIEMSFQKPFQYREHPISLLSVIWLSISILFTYISYSVLNDGLYIVACFLSCFGAVILMILEASDYRNRVAWQEEELIRSIERVSDPFYVLTLLRIGCKVPRDKMNWALDCAIMGQSVNSDVHQNAKAQNDIQKEFNEKKGTSRPIQVAVVLTMLLSLAIFGAVLMYNNSKESIQEETKSAETQERLFEYRRPENGAVFAKGNQSSTAPLKIISPAGADCYYVLKPTSSNKTAVRFYGRAGETVSISVPTGKYELYYASGKTWYGRINLFGSDTVYRKCDEVLSFTENSGCTISLNVTKNGNLGYKDVEESEFPKETKK